MQFRGIVVFLAALSCGCASRTFAQSTPSADEEPRVERVSFRGVDELDDRALRASVVTEETRCRSLLLKPFCWVTDWSGVVQHRYLDYDELERDVVRLRIFYFRQGFREAAVAAEVLPQDQGVHVVFHIEEGEPTLVEQLQVRQEGDVLSRRTIRRAGFPDEEDRLNLDDIDFGITFLEQRLGAAGYLDASLSDSVEVDRQARRANVQIAIEPGARSTLAEIDIQGNEDVADATIAEALRLKRGRVLRSNDILAARRSLYESNLFHEVDVTVPQQADTAKRVEVVVREAAPRTMRIGGGFNTLEFVQFETRFTHYDWLGGGRRLDLRGVVGNLLASQLNDRLFFRNVLPEEGFGERDAFLRPTFQASVGFMQPAFPSADNVVGIDLFANRRTIPGIVVDRGYGAQLSVTRRLDYDMRLSLSYAYELTAVESGQLYFCVNYAVCDLGTIEALRGTNALSPLSLNLQIDRANNPIAPTSGHRIRLDLEHASRLTVSDFRYNRISGEATYYWPRDLNRRRVLAGRLRLGWVRHLSGTAAAIGIERDAQEALLHPRKRFYAGGSRSVRGFGENQLGPQLLTVDPAELLEGDQACTPQQIADGTCDPHVAEMQEFLPRSIGGTSVVEASVEYRFPFAGGVTAAVFLDGALVGEGIAAAFTDGTRAVTPGVGVRFATPVGPVRIDLGIRPNLTERLPVITEFEDADGRRRLIELETPRRYNAVEAAGGGFLDEIFSRLALHLSIGEAY